MDPNNPVVKLCMAGMEAEVQQQFEDARQLFEEAWAARTDDYEATIAAHYVARMQEDQEEKLRWNQLALDHARKVDDARVIDFYPSLYLNLGWSHEMVGDLTAARACYEAAAERAAILPESGYTDVVMNGISRALKRTDV